MKTLLSIAISASFLSVACGGSDGSGSWSAYVDQTANKYQGCGVLSDGQFGPSNSDAFPDEGPSAVDRCELDCILAASCEEIEDGICRDVTSPELESCLDACDALEPKFICADSGEEIPLSFECDDFNDCEDGSDEVGCPPVVEFECTDGTLLPESYECDGEADCEDGSDEVGCPPAPEYRCDDGSTVPAGFECDGGEPDCADGSDESHCAVVTCPDVPA